MKRKTAQEWSDLVRRWQRSGETARDFGARQGVSPGQLSWWRWHLKRGPKAKPAAVATSRALVKAPPSPVLEFLPVRLSAATVIEATCRDEPPRGLEVVLTNGRVVRVPGLGDAAQLVWVLAAAEASEPQC